MYKKSVLHVQGCWCFAIKATIVGLWPFLRSRCQQRWRRQRERKKKKAKNFIVHFVAVVARLRRKTNFTFCGARRHKRTIFFSFLGLRFSPLETNSSKIQRYLTIWLRWNWNKRDQVCAVAVLVDMFDGGCGHSSREDKVRFTIFYSDADHWAV